MSQFVKILAFFAFFLAFSAWPQSIDLPNRAQGTFIANSQGLNQTPVSFMLEWSEENGRIDGTYQDNFYTTGTKMEGSSTDLGKVFKVELPNQSLGVKHIVITSPQRGPYNGSLSMSVTTRDLNGTPVNTANFTALVTSNSSAVSLSQVCTIGYGELSGFCGLYGGYITETLDSRNKCNLISVGDLRLELSTDTEINLYLNYVRTTAGLPMHSLGLLPAAPLATINQSSRNCGPLPGTDMSESCQRLNISGNFLSAGESKSFSGTYTIVEEGTNDTCTYSLQLTRGVQY